MLTARVVVPDPPLADAKAMTRPGAACAAAARRWSPAGSFLAEAGARSQQCLDERLQLAWVDGPGEDVVGAGLQQLDSRLHVTAVRHGEDRRMGAARLVVDPSAEHCQRRGVGRVEDDELVIAEPRQRAGRIAHHGNGHAAALEWLNQLVGRLAVSREQQDARRQLVGPECSAHG